MNTEKGLFAFENWKLYKSVLYRFLIINTYFFPAIFQVLVQVLEPT